MRAHIEKLLSIASPALSAGTARLMGECAALAGPLGPSLVELLQARNGFYAFESALHVRPLSDEPVVLGVVEWNAPDSWRSEFRGLADGVLFFAEDIFGGQFCIADGAIQRFDPETGDRERLAASIDEWAGVLLGNAGPQTGWPLAHQWQEQFGPLASEMRLVPKVPFVLGGPFTVANLHALDSVQAMKFYGNLATQIHDAPDGTRVELRVPE